MVVCKFFQEGYCRYGKNCRFEHVYGSKYTYHANPQPKQTAPVQSQPAVVTDEQLVNQVQSDIQAALRGGQWILSCYLPFKEKPLFPGLTDLSPEEARLFIYEAKATNNIKLAVTYMNQLFQETRQKYEQLLQPNVNIIKVLRSLYNGEVVASPFTNQPQNNLQPNTFNNTNNAASSIFRSAAQTSPVLNPNANNAQSVFSQAANNSMFNTQSPDPAKQLFSQANNTNVFGPSQPPVNIFAPQNQSSAAQSIFATAAQSNFNVTSQSNPSNIFATANQNVFARQPSQQIQNTSPFSQGNVFQTNQNQTSIFGHATNNQKTDDDPGVYSKMEDLSDMDLEAFKSDSFQLGFIPELPPPHELCNAPTGISYFN